MRQQVNSVSSTVVTTKPLGRTCLVLVMALHGFFSVFYDAVIAIRCMQIQSIIFIVNHFRVRRNKNLPKELKYMKFNLLLVMSEQNLFCPTKMVSLVGHMFFQAKKKFTAL